MKSILILRRPIVAGFRRQISGAGRWFAAAVGALFCAGALANAGDSAVMSLDQLIAAAQYGNKDLQAARFAVDAARARLIQAGALPNPRVNLNSGNDFAFNNEGAYSASFGLSQDFPVAGRLARQKQVALVDIDLAKVEIADAQRRLAGEVAANVYRILVLDRQIQVRDALSAVDERLAKVTRSRFKAAEVSELDVNTVALDLQRLTQERLLLQTQRKVLLQSLNQQLGRPANSVLAIAESLPAIDPLPPLESELARALAQRPDQRLAQLQIDRAESDIALANAKRWEDWSVGLGVQQDRQSIDGVPPQRVDRSLVLSVTIPLSLKSRTRGLIAEAEVGATRARAQSSANSLKINSEVSAAHAEASSLQTLLKTYETNLLPLSDRNIKLAETGYSRGLVTVLEVVQALRQQAELKTAALNTLDLYLQSLTRLRTAVSDYALITEPNP